MTGPDALPDPYQRGLALHRSGQLEQAAACYREALARHPDDHRAMHAMGTLALQTGALREAHVFLSNAVRLAGDQADYHVSLARLQQTTGQQQEALGSYRRALQIDADHYPARFRLALLLHRTGELEQALEAYRAAASIRGDDPLLLVNFGALLNLLGQSEDALPLYRKAIELKPGMAAAHGNLGNALAALGRHEEAIEAFRHSLTIAPGQPMVHANLGSCHLARGEVSAARTAFETCLRDEPGDITSLAMLAAILNEQGETGLTHALMDFENLMSFTRIMPPGQQDLSAYLAALRSAVLSHGTLKTDPESHTTRHGQQTGSLMPADDPAIKHLIGQIHTAARTYISRRDGEWQPIPELPALWAPPDNFRLDVWATVLGGGGHQAPHIHPSGWLSGVFYVDIPMPEDDTSEAGWIEFGCLPEDVPLHAEPITRRHRPLAGQLVLFPSYFFHRTIPLTDEKPRISIAFDVVPDRRG